MYNNAISFTSLGATIDRSVRGPKGVHVFRVSGTLTHKISPIEPTNPSNAGFPQIFVVGSGGTDEAKHRIQKAQGLGGDTGYGSRMMVSTVKHLMTLMYKFNPYAHMYKLALTVLKENGAFTLSLQGVSKPGSDPKRYNEPTVDEVAVIIQGKNDVLGDRQIALHQKEGYLEFIDDNHSSYFPLRYPIFFLYGAQQWDNLYTAWTDQGKHFNFSFSI
jgi:hypothetical protein